MKPRIFNPFRSGISAVISVLSLGCFAAPSAFAVERTWTGDGSTSQWNIDGWANFGAGGALNNGDDLVFGPANTNGFTLTSVGAARTYNSLTFKAGSPAYDIRLTSAPSGGFTDQDIGFGAGNTGITVEAGDTSPHTIGLLGGQVNLNDDLTVTHNGSGTLTIDRPITGVTFGLTKEGTGTMKLDGANTYDGATQINGGILTIGSLAAFGSTSGVTAGASGTIGLGLGTSGTTTHYGFAELSDLFNTSLIGFTLDSASAVAVDTTALDFPIVNQSGGGSPLTGSRSLIKLGPNAVQLNQTNTYTGDTIIKEGGVNVGAGLNGGVINPAGSIIVESGGTFGVNLSRNAAQGTDFSTAPITGAGNFEQLGSGVTTLNVANTYSGTTTITNGTLVLGTVDAIGGSSAIVIEGGATLQPNVVGATITAPITVGGTGTNATITGPSISSGGNAFTLNGAISGDGNVILDSVGPNNAGSTIVLNGASTYAGSTRMSCSIGANSRLFVKLGTENALPATTVLTIDGGAGTGSGRQTELDLNGNNQTLAGLTSVVRNLRVHRVVNDSATDATLTINNSDNYTFPEELGDSGGNNFGLTKTGSGTFTLSGSSTYTGATSISDGALGISNLSALGNTSGITIGDGGTLLPNLDGLTIGVPITLDSTVTPATINAPTTGGSGVVQTLTVNGAISGAGDLILNGSSGGNSFGTIVLNAASTYVGSTRLDCSVGGATCWVNNGTTNTLPTTTVLTLDGGPGAGSGRTLRYDLNGFNQTLAGLTNVTGLVARNQQVTNTGAPATLTVNNSGDYTFGGAVDFNFNGPKTSRARIQGAISLAKSGVGTFTLASSHTYTGDTTVNEGTLSLEGINNSNESSTVTIADSGATLDLAFTGTDTVDKLFIGTTQMAAGVYGPTATDITQITGTGTLIVTSGPVGGYSSWASTNGAGVNLDDDHDDDGVSNGVEYFIGGPSGDTTGFTSLPGVDNTAGTLSVTWTHAADYAGVYGTDFVVETSETLATGSWTTATTSGTPATADTVHIDGDNVTYTYPSGTKKFARLKITGP